MTIDKHIHPLRPDADTCIRLRDMWHCATTKRDLLRMLNLALGAVHGEHSQAVTFEQLTRYADSSCATPHYTTFRLPKKRPGEYRTIDAPVPGLRRLQQGLNLILQCVHTPHAAATGFVPRRSVVDNARVHLGQRLVYNIDLQDFFPSITAGRLYRRLTAKPFSLNPRLASLVTDLCCHTAADGRRVLPQGAPTSPTITNFICEQLDRKLTRLAKAYGLKYSRYADDITFSGMTHIFYEASPFVRALHRIVEDEEHFTINPAKTRLCHQGMRQEVTGLTVNSKENVARSYLAQLRTLLHNWEFDGYDAAQTVFASHYRRSRTRHLHLPGTPRLENVVWGKLQYLKMVKGSTDPAYRALAARYDALARQICETKNKNTI